MSGTDAPNPLAPYNGTETTDVMAQFNSTAAGAATDSYATYHETGRNDAPLFWFDDWLGLFRWEEETVVIPKGKLDPPKLRHQKGHQKKHLKNEYSGRRY